LVVDFQVISSYLIVNLLFMLNKLKMQKYKWAP